MSCRCDGRGGYQRGRIQQWLKRTWRPAAWQFAKREAARLRASSHSPPAIIALISSSSVCTLLMHACVMVCRASTVHVWVHTLPCVHGSHTAPIHYH